MSEHLHHKMAALQQSLLQGKLPRSLHWSDALELIGHLGQVEAQGNDDFAFVVGGQREVFKRPRTPELGVEEVSRLRKFLKHAGSRSASSEQAQDSRMVVVIDHHSARVFQLGESRAKPEATVKPHDPHHFHHHLVHRKESHYQGDRVPEESSFYEEVAAILVAANEVVLIGSGTGNSSAVEVLLAYLRKHHADIARRVKATEIADLSALTDPEMEAIAKRHMTGS